jgi:hypothetical protein
MNSGIYLSIKPRFIKFSHEKKCQYCGLTKTNHYKHSKKVQLRNPNKENDCTYVYLCKHTISLRKWATTKGVNRGTLYEDCITNFGDSPIPCVLKQEHRCSLWGSICLDLKISVRHITKSQAPPKPSQYETRI